MTSRCARWRSCRRFSDPDEQKVEHGDGGTTHLPLAAAAVTAAVAFAAAIALLTSSGASGAGTTAVWVAVVVLIGASVSSAVRRVRREDLRRISLLEAEREDALQACAERDALSRRLTHQAGHDALTGLPNRTLFLERLHDALRSGDPGAVVGVLFLDLDDFKTVNDSLGHAAGDELLVGISQRLQNALRAGDLVARFGGDEFAVLLLDGGTAEQVSGVANRLLGVLRAPFALGAGMASGQASGGLVLEERDRARTVEEQGGDLTRQADLAMYAAESAGGGRCVGFQVELQEAMRERLALQDEITRALIEEQFSLEYQPVVDLRSSEVVAVEALVRWHHPERGDLSPDRFIPIAERSGAIVPLGLWVLEQACLDLQLWDELAPGNEVRISVNVSPRQLRDRGAGPQIARVLHRAGVDPRRLVLEVTESMLMDDGETAAATLWQLRALGIRIAIDDFGTGYSSVSRARRPPAGRPEDRPHLHRRAGAQPRRRHHRHRGHRDGARAGAEGRGRGRRDAGPAGLPERGGVRPGAGLPVQPAGPPRCSPRRAPPRLRRDD